MASDLYEPAQHPLHACTTKAAGCESNPKAQHTQQRPECLSICPPGERAWNPHEQDSYNPPKSYVSEIYPDRFRILSLTFCAPDRERDAKFEFSVKNYTERTGQIGSRKFRSRSSNDSFCHPNSDFHPKHGLLTV